jgi:hypothetical protein
MKWLSETSWLSVLLEEVTNVYATIITVGIIPY